MPQITLRSICIAIVLLLVYPLAAAGQSAESEVEAVLDEYKAALEALDVEAIKSFLASKFTLTSYNCVSGEDSREPRDEMLDDLRKVASIGATMTKVVTGREISFLGGGPIAVVRQLTHETLSTETGSLSLQASETYYLNKIGGSYKITSASTRTACESVQITGTLPEIPEG